MSKISHETAVRQSPENSLKMAPGQDGSRLGSAFDRFLFAAESVHVMPIFRIAVGAISLLDLLCLRAPNISAFYGEPAIISVKQVELHFFGSAPHLNLLNCLPESSPLTYAVFALAVICAIALTLGFKTRISALLLWVLLLSFNNRNPLILNGADLLLCFCSLMLVFSNGGQRLSIDAYLAGRRAASRISSLSSNQMACWAQRMLQLQIAFIYMASWSSKISGEYWRDGTAVYYALRLSDLIHLPLPGACDTMLSMQFLTWFTLGVELSLFTLVWFKRYRLVVIVLGLILHMGIDLTMNIPLFEWLFMACLIVFLDDDDLRKVKGALAGVRRLPVNRHRFENQPAASN